MSGSVFLLYELHCAPDNRGVLMGVFSSQELAERAAYSESGPLKPFVEQWAIDYECVRAFSLKPVWDT